MLQAALAGVPVPSPTVSVEWLGARLAEQRPGEQNRKKRRKAEHPRVHVLDCSWYLPQSERDPAAEYAARHIRGARYFNQDVVADRSNPLLPHMLPTVEQFATAMDVGGVHPTDTIVCYDNTNILCGSARMYWMCHVFGAISSNVCVLEGTVEDVADKFPQLVCAPLEQKTVEPQSHAWCSCSSCCTTLPRSFWPRTYVASWVCSQGELIEYAEGKRKNALQVLDARSWKRYLGLVTEPRPAMTVGHIAGALSLEFTSTLQLRHVVPSDRDRQLSDFASRCKTDSELREWFSRGAMDATGSQVGIDMKAPVVCYCGSGITTAVLWLTLRRAGHTSVRMYDGSWAEWGNDASVAMLTEQPTFASLFLLATSTNCMMADGDIFVEVKRLRVGDESDKSKVFFWLRCNAERVVERLNFVSMEQGGENQSRCFEHDRTLAWNDDTCLGSWRGGAAASASVLRVMPPANMSKQLAFAIMKWLKTQQ